MTDADRQKLQRILAAFDDNGLIALANKGLVRRAAKDLEAGGLSHEETDTLVLVRGPGWMVTMPVDGPARATDDTAASGITRQILTATMYLRNHWQISDPVQETSDAESIEQKPLVQPVDDSSAMRQALLDITFDDLQKWAGKTTAREALRIVKAQPETEIETRTGLTIRLIKHEIEARLLPGAEQRTPGKLLDQLLTTAPKSQHKCWVVVAVLALQQHDGKMLEIADDAAPADDAGAPRSRLQVLNSTRELLANMTAAGLAHPSQRLVERLSTLSVSATGVHLPRLSRLLRALADEVSLILARHAQADSTRLFELACFTDALALALTNAEPRPPLALAGRHRTEYEPAGDLLLTGLGAFPWRTPSGFEGVTVLFWEAAGERFLTYTNSRPINSAGRLDLKQYYQSESVWIGAGASEQLSRSLFQLCDARVNPVGRLSASQKSTAEAAELSDPSKIDFGQRAFPNWYVLQKYVRTIWPIGLTERNPLERIVILQPATWGERVFDELQQRLVWQLWDAKGLPIELALHWTEVNEPAIAFLEAVNPQRDRLSGVVARIHFTGKGLQFEPLSLLSAGTPGGDCVLNPGFDQQRIKSKQSHLLEKLRKKFGRDRIAVTMTTGDEDDDALTETIDALPTGLQTPLSETEGLLLRLAESGTRQVHESTHQRIKRLATSFKKLGFSELAKSLIHGDVALLQCGYLCRLYRQAVGVASVVSEDNN